MANTALALSHTHTHLNLMCFNTFYASRKAWLLSFCLRPLSSSLLHEINAASVAQVVSSMPSPSYFLSSKHPQPSNLRFFFLLFPSVSPPSCFPSHPLFLYLNWLCLSPSAGSSFSGPAPVHTSSPVGHLFSQPPPHLHLSFLFLSSPSLSLSVRRCQGRSWLG